ncbi:MAG TPA: TerB family tellurite resistance protein [Candidatus Poseidoniales archaeon]|nr:TerB family tellurite resistance protein [Candidatus Poseidoniales archaeon]
MLPDTLHTLPQTERFAYAKLLAHVTRIDEELTIDEMAVFEQRLGTALLSPSQRKEVRNYLKNPPSLESCLRDLGPVSGRLALRDATLMTAADGHVDPEERVVLDAIAVHVGLGGETVDALLEWVLRGYDWMQDGLDLLNN